MSDSPASKRRRMDQGAQLGPGAVGQPQLDRGAASGPPLPAHTAGVAGLPPHARAAPSSAVLQPDMAPTAQAVLQAIPAPAGGVAAFHTGGGAVSRLLLGGGAPQHAPASARDAVSAADVSAAIAEALRPVLTVPPLAFSPALQTPAVAAAAAAAAAVAASEIGNTFNDPLEAATLGLGGPLLGQVPTSQLSKLAPQLDVEAFDAQDARARASAAAASASAVAASGAAGGGLSGLSQAMSLGPAPAAAVAGASVAEGSLARLPATRAYTRSRGMSVEEEEEEEEEVVEEGDDAGAADDRDGVHGMAASGPAGGQGRERGGRGGGKKRRYLAPEVTSFLKHWLKDHIESPYPDEQEKAKLCEATGLTLKQVSNWFLNARKRLWRPMLREQGHDVSLIAPRRVASHQRRR